VIRSIRLAQPVAAALREHAAAALPEEACGLLVGERSRVGWRVTRAIRCANVAPAESRTRRFEIDPGVVIRTRSALRGGAEELIGFYHSHPTGGGALSDTDLAYARNWPATLWAVVPVADGSAGEPRLWWLDTPASEPREVEALGVAG